MDFEWDEAKRLSNIAKHSLDFLRATKLFDGRPHLDLKSPYPAEERHLRVALLDGIYVTVVWTWRGRDNVRIISVRRSRDDEKGGYQALHCRGH
jgi:uncharacterized DUF497 family protein